MRWRASGFAQTVRRRFHEHAWLNAMTALLSKPIWLERFGNELMRMDPSLNAVKAAEFAVATHPGAYDIRPEKAAQTFLREGADRDFSRSE